jgi:hypothetical protein
MALYFFTASHGVHLGQPAWAVFKRDEALDTAGGERRYSFATEDKAVADKLRKIKDHGIREVK